MMATPEVDRPVPDGPIRRYAVLASARAAVEPLDDGSWYAEVEDLPGVWAEGASEQDALETLRDVIREWVILKIRDRDPGVAEDNWLDA